MTYPPPPGHGQQFPPHTPPPHLPPPPRSSPPSKGLAGLSTTVLAVVAVVLAVGVVAMAVAVFGGSSNDDETSNRTAPVPGAPVEAGGPIPPGATEIGTVKNPQYGSPVAVFTTADGNIGCGIDDDGLRCRVSSYDRDKPLGVDRTGGAIDTLTIENGAADISYHGSDVPPWADRAFGASDRMVPQVVSPGQTVFYKTYVCHSGEAGLTCWDSATRAGALVTRDRTDTFVAEPQETTAEQANDDEKKCSGLTGEQAVVQNVGKVPAFKGWPWSTEYAMVENYDQCLPLSAIVLPIEGGTASSPYQVMLFHHGEYIGTATERAHGFAPEVARVDDTTIAVTWTWPRAGESSAGATGKSRAQFRWDDASGEVVMTGEEPSGT
ncbi:MAG: LppP/LprE family lipoprotein [Gordonia sp. (in: high G+C Gram-positive bacteria)]|uniref:LppP/LprE family lipoprotein n=1 Tax=Gordonia sp. (in: high G+C Gram-positive bacteria) TaxID=84139 RepID=UPI0039E5CDB4